MIHERCFHFRPDRPCVYHKDNGQECAECPHVRLAQERILFIKLGAMGDVLRTTAVLPPLQRKHPRGHISWLVEAESAPLLENNPSIQEVWRLGPETAARLQVEEFELCINLDLGVESLALASVARAKEKLGYGLGSRGEVVRYNPEAEDWYLMSHSDPLKKANRETYQAHMLRILRLDSEGARIIVNCPDEERGHAKSFLGHWAPDGDARPIVGLNLGAGGRWECKRWPLRQFEQLAERLVREQSAAVVLLAGEGEDDDRRRFLDESTVRVVDTGSRNALPRFAAFVSLCDVVVTGDTMALHMALGLDRRVVAVFGPTSAHEIEMYGLGSKLTAEMDCLGCYRERCERSPNCMESITVEQVYDTVLGELERAGKKPAKRMHAR